MRDPPNPIWPQQSPINIAYAETLRADFPDDYLVVSYPNIVLKGVFLGDNFIPADPVQLQFAGSSCTLLKVHIHSPSEHTLESRDSSFEIHFVHQIDYPNGGSAFMVIGVLFDEESGAVSPDSIRTLSRKLGGKGAKSRKRKSANFTHGVNLFHFLPENHSEWYRYEGSLTSGTHAEDVSWIVMRHPRLVNPDDVAELEKYAEQGAWPSQRTNRRFVLRNFDL